MVGDPGKAVQRKQVRQVRDRQQQRRRVRQPHGGQREQCAIELGLAGDREYHRSEQDSRRVEAEHDGARDSQHDDQQPESKNASARHSCGPVGGHVEDAGPLGDLGDDRERDQEPDDRSDALD